MSVARCNAPATRMSVAIGDGVQRLSTREPRSALAAGTFLGVAVATEERCSFSVLQRVCTPTPFRGWCNAQRGQKPNRPSNEPRFAWRLGLVVSPYVSIIDKRHTASFARISRSPEREGFGEGGREYATDSQSSAPAIGCKWLSINIFQMPTQRIHNPLRPLSSVLIHRLTQPKPPVRRRSVAAAAAAAGRATLARDDPSEAGKGSCPKCGCFLPTNTVALIHGGRSLAARSGTALDPAEYVAIRDAVLDDLGGEAEVSTAMYELVCLFAAACVLCKVMWRHIEATGPLTKVGRKRACVDLYLAASTRADRLAKQIGTDRRAVRATLAEVMADE